MRARPQCGDGAAAVNAELDVVLAKISREGLTSLNASEREVLAREDGAAAAGAAASLCSASVWDPGRFRAGHGGSLREHACTMALHDRDYYREDQRSGLAVVSRWSVNTWIIVVNVAIFVIEFVSRPFQQFVFDHGYFSTEKMTWGGGLEFWRFLTFQFLHANPVHVAFNMMGLYIFGGMVEEHLGRKKYLAFYLVCGVFGAFMYLLLNLLGGSGSMIFTWAGSQGCCSPTPRPR